MKTRIIPANPNDLKLLDMNARFMRHEVFSRLVANIQDDATLTSVPFCIRDPDGERQRQVDPTTGEITDGPEIKWLVVSGNHRVKAAQVAGLTEIFIMVTEDPLTEDEWRAIQLAHNAITGEDDPALLKQIYMKINSPSLKLYTGLDDKKLELMPDVNPMTLKEAQLLFQSVRLASLPSEITEVHTFWDRIKEQLKGSHVWLASQDSYDKTLDTLEVVSESYGIKNVATCLQAVLAIAERHLDELQDGWLDKTTDTARDRTFAPLVTIFNKVSLPSHEGKLVNDAIKRLIADGVIKHPIDALAYWAKHGGAENHKA